MKKKSKNIIPRADSKLREIPVSDWLTVWEDALRIKEWKTHAAQLNKKYNVKFSRASYYRTMRRLAEIEFERQCRTPNTSQETATLESTIAEKGSVCAAIHELSKSIDALRKQQTYMAGEIRQISDNKSDAFIMYMDMRNLNRVLRNSAFVSDAFSTTEDIPYPGKRKVPIATIHEYLLKLEKRTQKRLDVFLRDGLQKRFDRKDLSDAELFMLRIRLIWGCEIVRELERDTQIPLTNDKKSALDATVRGIEPDVLFVDLWANIGTNWLYNFASMIYKYGKLPTQHTQTVGIAHELNMLQRLKESRQ